MNQNRIAWIIVFTTAAGPLGACKPSAAGTDGKDKAKEAIHAVGYLEPREKLRRLSFQSHGVITQIHAKIGDSVKAGEVIARLDDAVEQSALTGAQAKLSMTEANRKLVLAGAHPDDIAALEAATFQAAFATLRVKKASAELGKANHQVRDEDRLLLDEAVKSACAEVVAAEVAMAQKTLKAPVDGKVVEIFL